MQLGRRRFFVFGIIGILLVGTVSFVIFSLNSKLDGEKTVPDQSSMSSVNAVKIYITDDGIYRLTADDLHNGGLNLQNLDYTNLNLSHSGQQIPFLLVEDSLVFYGQEPDNRYSPYRSYVLELGVPGLAMGLSEKSSNTMVAITAITQTLHFEENHLYDGRTRQEDQAGKLMREPWYWANITVGDRLELELAVPRDVSGQSEISFGLWGVSYNETIDNDHDLDIEVNGSLLGTIRWDGESYFEGQVVVPTGIFSRGTNTVSLDNSKQGVAPIDIMHLDWIEIKYLGPAHATEDRLTIQGVEGSVAPDGFSGSPLFFDVAKPSIPVMISTQAESNPQPILAVEEDMVIVGVGPDGYLKPEGIQPIRSSQLGDSDIQADLIVISPKAFVNELEPLLSARESQGLSVVVARLEEVYDTFGHSQSGPESITAFIRFAFEKWREPKPQYLLLVGEGSYDYRGYLEDGPENAIPAPMVSVYYGGETVSDSRLADIDGDGNPEIAVGRWPVDSPKEVRSLVERTLAYERGQSTSRALFTADETSDEFSELNDIIIKSSGIKGAQVEKLVGPSTSELTEAWNAGAWLVTYTGHGSLDRWSKAGMFSSEDVNGLTLTSSPPIVLQLTCLTGFFAHPTSRSLSETMLLSSDGPVLIIAATSLTLSDYQRPFGANFLRYLQDPSVERIGDALQLAKLSLDLTNDSMQEISDTFGLLGDPSALIVRPKINSS